jgi:phosphatidylethanolamine-binding protein (PEBP) family uncharacterized protein
LKIWNRTSAGLAALLAAVAIAGCGEGSSKSASAAATTTTTPATTSTAAKKPSSIPSNTTTTPSKPPAAKASTKASKAPESEQGFGKIKLTSTAFKPGKPIAVKYTCGGSGASPPLQWHGVPPGTVELFLLAIDLSGGTNNAIQWAVTIPAGASSIPAGSLPAGAVTGLNSEGKAGWGGICGAKGQQQRVAFLFYALNRKLGLKSGFNPIAIRGGLKGATLGTGLTVATYKRP